MFTECRRTRIWSKLIAGICLVLMATLMQPGAIVAQSEEPPAQTPTEVPTLPTEVPAPPTEAPSPTEKLPPPPMEVPPPLTETPPPTEAPPPTEVPPSTETPALTTLNEPTEAMESTPTQEIVSTPTVTSTEVVPTPTLIPLPSTDSLVALTSLEPVILQPGTTHSIELTYQVTTPRIATTIHAELRDADGWTLGAQGVPGDSSAVTLTETGALMPGSSFGLVLTITAPAEVTAEDVVQLHIRSAEVTNLGEMTTPVTGESPTMTLTVVPALLPAPVTADFDLSCDTSAVNLAVGDEPITATCTFAGLDTLDDREAILSQLEIIAPDGWTLDDTDTTLTITPDQVIGAGGSFDASFLIAPDGCGVKSGPLLVHSRLLYEGTDPITGPTTSLVAEVVIPPPSLPLVSATFLGFTEPVWAESRYTPANGTVAMTITPSDEAVCPAPEMSWALQVTTSGLYSANSGDAMIPAESIIYLGAPSSAGAPAGVSPVTSDVPLASGKPVTIAYGNASIDEGGTWNAQFLLSPPGTVPPGTYGGVFDVTVINAP